MVRAVQTNEMIQRLTFSFLKSLPHKFCSQDCLTLEFLGLTLSLALKIRLGGFDLKIKSKLNLRAFKRDLSFRRACPPIGSFIWISLESSNQYFRNEKVVLQFE